MYLIILAGQKGVGKTTVADYLHDTLLKGSVKFSIHDAIVKHIYDLTTTGYTYEDFVKLCEDIDNCNTNVLLNLSEITTPLYEIYNSIVSLTNIAGQEAKLAELYVKNLKKVHTLLPNTLLIIDDIDNDRLYKCIRARLLVDKKCSHVFNITRNTKQTETKSGILNYTYAFKNSSDIKSLLDAVRVQIKYIALTDFNWPIKLIK